MRVADYAWVSEREPITAKIYMKLVSNPREHWAVRARRVKHERHAAHLILVSHQRPEPPLVVRLARVTSPRGKLMDDDNLRLAFKAVRDGVADWLRIDDGDPRVEWLYSQHQGNDWAIHIAIERKEA